MKKILILGEFSSGKTAFINMLLGYPVLPEKMTSTDLPVVKIESGNKSKLSYTDTNNNVTEISSWSNTPSDWKRLKTLNISIKGHPLIDEVTLYDTPGINTTNTHHLEHIETFLSTNSKNYKLVLFFIPDKLSKTSVDFLNKWKSKFKNIILVTNIKDVKDDSECRKIEKSIKRTAMNEIGSIPIHLLSIGDLYEQFFEHYENTDSWETITDWKSKTDYFNELIDNNINSLIGEDIFEIIESAIESKEKEIEDYTSTSDDELTELIRFDDPRAMFEKAIRYFNKEMFDEAVPLLRDAVKFNNSDAENALGICYENGLGVTENLEAASEFYNKSANNNNNKGLLSLGLFLLNYENNSWDKAFNAIEKSANLGNQQAELELGRLYLDEKKLNEAKAFELIDKAAKNNIAGAHSLLAWFYQNGVATKPDIKKAIKLHKTGIVDNDPYSYYNLYLLHDDDSIDYKTTEAFSYIQKAAEADLSEAQYYFAIELEKRRNHTEAFEWYKKSYENSYQNAGVAIAECYLEGHGVKLDKERGFLLLHKLSEEGNESAKTQLAFCYANGEGVIKDEKRAINLLIEAANNNDYDAQLNLINCYGNGILTKKNYEEAFYWEKRVCFFDTDYKIKYINKINDNAIKRTLLQLQKELKNKLQQNGLTKATEYVIDKTAKLNDLKEKANALTVETPIKEVNALFEEIKNFNSNTKNSFNTNNFYEINYLELSKEILELTTKELKLKWDKKTTSINTNLITHKLKTDVKLKLKLGKIISEIEKEFQTKMADSTKTNWEKISYYDTKAFDWQNIVKSTNLHEEFFNRVFPIINNIINKNSSVYPSFSNPKSSFEKEISNRVLIRLRTLEGISIEQWHSKKYKTSFLYSQENLTTFGIIYALIGTILSSIGFFSGTVVIPIVVILTAMGIYLGFLKRREKIKEDFKAFQKDALRHKLLPRNVISFITDLGKTDKLLFEEYDTNGNISNRDELFFIIEEEAESGDAIAQYELGLAYEKGEGVTKDINEAIKWHTKAAEQGEIHAQFRLTIINKNNSK